MADPQHEPELDSFDRLTVVLYRFGIGMAAVAVALIGVGGLLSWPTWLGHMAMLAATALLVADLHLYDKRIRWVIGAAGWVGACLLFAGSLADGEVARWVSHAGLGFLFVTLSALALKERFCFRIWGLRAVPALLAASLIPQLGGWPVATASLLVPASLVVAALAVAKVRMPLHFDVGNKSAYQV